MKNTGPLVVTAAALAVACLLFGYIYSEWLENKASVVVEGWYFRETTQPYDGMSDTYLSILMPFSIEPAAGGSPADDEPDDGAVDDDEKLPPEERWKTIATLTVWYVRRTLPARSKHIGVNTFIVDNNDFASGCDGEDDVMERWDGELKAMVAQPEVDLTPTEPLTNRYVLLVDENEVGRIRADSEEEATDRARELLRREIRRQRGLE